MPYGIPVRITPVINSNWDRGACLPKSTATTTFATAKRMLGVIWVRSGAKRLKKLALIAFAITAFCAGRAAKAHELPSCESEFVKTTFIKAINNSPSGRVGGLDALDLKYSVEVYAGDDGTIRLCKGQALLNVGEREYYILLEREGNGTAELTAMTEQAVLDKSRHSGGAIDNCMRDICRINVTKQGKIGNRMDGTKRTTRDGACMLFCMYGFTMKLE